MKTIAILLLLCLFVSCSDSTSTSSDSSIVGSWKLIEVLADPGDGSGTFTPIASEKVIIFYDNGTLASNGTLCDMSNDVNIATTGTYDLTSSTFSSDTCFDPSYAYTFEQDGTVLIIDYPCIEPCKAKFEKQ